jgi:hypothetical protein
VLTFGLRNRIDLAKVRGVLCLGQLVFVRKFNITPIALCLFVVRTFETSLAQGPSYTFGSSSPVSFRFERPRL